MNSEANERPEKPVLKFESMLKTDDIYFFDAEDFEDIIHHYLNNGKIALGKKAIKIGLEQHPGNVELKLLKVEVLVFEDKLEDAEKMLNKISLLDATNEEVFIQRANIYSKRDDHLAAIKYLQQALAISDESFDIYSLLGMEYLFLDDFKNAKVAFIKCLEYDDEDYSSLYNIIYCFEFLEDFDGAIVFLNEHLEKHPYCEVAWHQLGKQYVEKKMYAEALSAFEFAIISEDTFIGAYFEKGRVLERMGRFKDAIENYETTIKLDDPTSHAYLRIANCYQKLGNDDMVKYYLYHAVHEDPLLDKGWLAITDYYFKKRKYTKALEYINRAININGDNAVYWKKCAQINNALKNYDEADFAYKQTIELGHNQLNTWLKWVKVLEHSEDYEAAIHVLSQAMVLYPDNPKLIYKKVGYYLFNNDKLNARVCLVKALKYGVDKFHVFQKEFPQFSETQWVQDIVAKAEKASK